MKRRRVRLRRERFPIAGVFRTSRDEKREVEVVVCELEEEGARGRGEGTPLRRYGHTPASVLAEAAALADALAGGLTREALQQHLSPGPARNAIDCALWDLEAKLRGVPVWRLAGLEPPRPIATAFTLSLDTPEAMAERAAAERARGLIKLKLGREGVLSRVRAVRAAAPRARLIVDANEAWTAELLGAVSPELAALGVELVEQPLAARADAALAELPHQVPLCADESCHDEVASLAGRYEAVNVKLDKTGGLTGALALVAAARASGLAIMVGSMVSTSLAIAPALLVAAGARWVDLDGALHLAVDRAPGLRLDGDALLPAPPELWG